MLLLVALLATVGSTQGDVAGSLEQSVLDLSNQVRSKNGLPPLVSDASLREAARTHSEEMARLNYFDHESPIAARRYPWDRVSLAGANADAMAENIYLAEGCPLNQVPSIAVRGWEHSPDHRANLLDPRMTNAGVGMAVRGGQVYVTEVFSSALSPLAPGSSR